ncbi:putative adhesin, partial [Streptomyces sp. WAC02707]|uniref:putative adhesin n=1 Tax=Streptomyces sp. WAC02707 TaxID=2487417 RepID=UPI0037DD3CF8
MAYILIGHGAMDVSRTPPDMEMVAIPVGTTLQFYAHPGQTMTYSPWELANIGDVKPPWAPLDHNHLTYNFCLTNAGNVFDEVLASHPNPGGYQPIHAGVGAPDPLYLCTGTPLTCPTSPAQISEGAYHQCDGILGTLEGEMHWLACTAIQNPINSLGLDVYLEGKPDGVGLGSSPDW